MSNKNCVIVFDQNEYGTYFTGQVVTGKVIITFNKPKKIKGVKLQICGYASCQWRDRCVGRARPIQKFKARKKHFYCGREDYIASTTFLVGSDQGKNFSMEAGTYSYAFTCPIPLNCPSSFEGTYGHIRYLTKVTFMRAGASDRTHNVGFTVLKVLDLNQESNLLKVPANNEALENICFFHNKAVYMKVDLMQCGYVPGQFILVSANVDNQSSFDCKRLIIMLYLRATYTADTPGMRKTSEKMCLVKKVCAPVPRHSQKHFAESIRVPATPPTCEHLSKVVRVSYEICVVAAMNHLMRNPKTVIPITIGNVPLATGTSSNQPSTLDLPTTSVAAARSLGTEADADDAGYEAESTGDETDDEAEVEAEVEVPPPTYEEAMFMTTNIADDDANTVSERTSFTPRYPVFNVDEFVATSAGASGPPPNKPQKRRKRRKRRKTSTNVEEEVKQEKPSVESPVQI